VNSTEKCSRLNNQIPIYILAIVHEVLWEFISTTIIVCVFYRDNIYVAEGAQCDIAIYSGTRVYEVNNSKIISVHKQHHQSDILRYDESSFWKV
jgi:hypothetical protein